MPRPSASPAAAAPRLEEVARRAGTSAITVSRALRQPGKVAPATLARIMAAVQALGYVPNLAASSLASRRSRIVAVLVPTIANSIFAETVQGLADTLRPAGYQLLLGDTAYSGERELELLRAVAGQRPDAVVVVGVVRDAPARALLRGLGVPVAETWELPAEPLDMAVGFSNAAAGAAMARHFLRGGRRRFGFAGGDDARAAARLDGYAREIAAAGLPPPARHEVAQASLSEGRRALARLLEQEPGLDALFCTTDILAAGALLECRARGIAVPARLALAGLGNLELGRELEPGLTTIDVAAHAIGRHAANLVLARLAGELDAPRMVDLGFTIIPRGST